VCEVMNRLRQWDRKLEKGIRVTLRRARQDGEEWKTGGITHGCDADLYAERRRERRWEVRETGTEHGRREACRDTKSTGAGPRTGKKNRDEGEGGDGVLGATNKLVIMRNGKKERK